MTETDTGKEPKSDLLIHIENEHASERGLCDLLESIADDLPGSINHARATPVIARLRSGLRRHIVLYERFLFPKLVERAETGDNAEALTTQAATEHAADECLAHDIADLLERALERGRVENAERLGYMLYCFFESRRRHLVWEETVILLLAKRRLNATDWRSFSSSEYEELLRGPVSGPGEFPDPGACGCEICRGKDKPKGDT